MRPHQGSVEGKENLPRPAGHTLLDAPQVPVCAEGMGVLLFWKLGEFLPAEGGERGLGVTVTVPGDFPVKRGPWNGDACGFSQAHCWCVLGLGRDA